MTVDEKASDIFNVSDWFYPFSIEFSILVVAVWYIMWSHIGQIHEHYDSLDFIPTDSGSGIDESFQQGHKNAMILFADCSSSTRGMFLGLVVLVLTVIGCIIVVVIMDECNSNDVIEITIGAEMVLFVIMTMASLAFYFKIGNLDI